MSSRNSTRSKSPAVIGTECAHCSCILAPPYAYITSEGRVICRCRLAKLAEKRRAWVERQRAAGTLRRQQDRAQAS